MKATLFLSIVVTAGLLAATLVLGTRESTAIDPPGTTTPTPGPSRVQSLKIDTDPTSNGPGPSGLGPWDSCASVAVGEKVAIDVVVELLPPVFAFPEAGLSGFGFNILYDQAIVSPTAEFPLAGISMLTNVGASSITSSGDPFPDSDGDLKIVKLDSSTNYEYGSGTLIRLEFTGVAAGDSTLTLGDTNAGDGDGVPNIYRSDGAIYDIGFLGPAHIIVDGACPTPSQSPVTTTPEPTTPEPTDPGTTTPTTTPTSTPIGPPTVTPTPTGTPAPTPTGAATRVAAVNPAGNCVMLPSVSDIVRNPEKHPGWTILGGSGCPAPGSDSRVRFPPF